MPSTPSGRALGGLCTLGQSTRGARAPQWLGNHEMRIGGAARDFTGGGKPRPFYEASRCQGWGMRLG